MTAPVILPDDEGGDFRQHRLRSTLSVAKINKILGFEPNVKDDKSKVKHSWGFTVDGIRCGVWDFYGERWSAFGPLEALEAVFGAENVL